MKFLFDFFPLVLFFVGYKFFGIYAATAIAMVASFTQVLCYRIKHQRYEKMHLISFVLIFVLGGATLFFHNPWFIKWKPTGIYWLTALFFLGSLFFTKKPLIQKLMENNVSLPPVIWMRLNLAWVVFFLLMGAMNLVVAYYYSTDVWVNFKLFGGTGFTMLFVFLQAFYLSRHVIEKDITQSVSRKSSSLS